MIPFVNGGVAIYSDSDYHIRSCVNEPYRLIKFVEPRFPLVASSEGHLTLWGTLYFEIEVNKQGKVTLAKLVDEAVGRKKAFVTPTRRAVERWIFDKSHKETRCFYITYVYHQPEIHRFD